MAKRTYVGEIQDNDGNAIYPHSDANVIWCSDGENVQKKISQYENSVGNVTGVTDSLEVGNKNILPSSVVTKKLNDDLKKKTGYVNSLNSFTSTRIVAINRTITYANGVGDLDISDMGIQVIFPLNVNVVGSVNTYGVIVTTINNGAGLRATLNNASYNGNLPTTFLLLCAD